MVKTVLQCPFLFRFTRMKKGSEYTERINIFALSSSLYTCTRYSGGEVYRSAGTAVTAVTFNTLLLASDIPHNTGSAQTHV